VTLVGKSAGSRDNVSGFENGYGVRAVVEPLVVLEQWLALPVHSFARATRLDATSICCDCSGLINLLCHELGLDLPYHLPRPKAVHYFNLLQEIGSAHIGSLQPGHLMAWRKERPPRSGDTGHVLVVSGPVRQTQTHEYRVPVIDSSQLNNGLARHELMLRTDDTGHIVGLRLHAQTTKVRYTAIYHQALVGSRFCFGCGLPRRACGCGGVEPILAAPPLVILRHPRERGRTLSTVSLIKQRYPSILVKDGELFSPLRVPYPVLVFPGAAGPGDAPAAPAPERTLILIDASWRKAKRILHRNSWLQALPRLDLKPDQGSDYRLRKVPAPDALSTVEAVAEVLDDPSLRVLFGCFMDRQTALMGEATYRQNYQHYPNFRPAD
jgi:DTW domain-containing protein YfiP